MFTGSSAKVGGACLVRWSHLALFLARWGCDKCVLGSIPVFEGDSPIDLHIGSVLEGAQVCAWRKHYWQEALVRTFLDGRAT